MSERDDTHDADAAEPSDAHREGGPAAANLRAVRDHAASASGRGPAPPREATPRRTAHDPIDLPANAPNGVDAPDEPAPRETDAVSALRETGLREAPTDLDDPVEDVPDPGAPAVPGGSDATRPPLDPDAPRDPDFERLLAEPGRFDAATAIRVAEARAAAAGKPLAITARPGNRLAATAIAAAAETEAEVRLETPLMGLAGALSPLPPAYTEIAARDRRRGAGGLAAFLDVFSGRLAQLYVAAAERHDMARLLRWHPPGRNRIVGALHALIGFGTPGMERLRPLPEDETLRHVAVLSGRIRSAEGLRAILGAELDLPVEVEQFRLRWRRLPQAELTRLGGAQRLGDAAAAGERAPDRGGQVRVRVGPVRYADFLSLAEGQERLRRLRGLARLHLGPVVDFDVQVVLDRRDVPRTQMGGDGPAARLGWNAWARTEPAARDAEEAVLGSAPRGAAA